MKLYALLLSCALSACAGVATTSFDPNEYGAWVAVSYQAKQATAACGTSTEQLQISKLISVMGYTALYSSSKNLNAQLADASNIVSGLIIDLNARYVGGKTPSLAYCQIKTTEIDVAARRVAFSLSKKET